MIIKKKLIQIHFVKPLFFTAKRVIKFMYNLLNPAMDSHFSHFVSIL